MKLDWREHITVDPEVCHGAPCFKGTRVSVAVVLDNLAAGANADEIAAEYPSLPQKATQVAMAYAAELARERVVEIPGSDAA